MDWKQKEVWSKTDGKTFTVEVVHWTRGCSSEDQGRNCWNVYANIYKAHPMFPEFDLKQTEYQEATNGMPLHGGPTYSKVMMDRLGKEVVGFEVGSDYAHFMDERFSHYSTKEGAYEVFRDAEDLICYLESRRDEAKKGEVAE